MTHRPLSSTAKPMSGVATPLSRAWCPHTPRLCSSAQECHVSAAAVILDDVLGEGAVVVEGSLQDTTARADPVVGQLVHVTPAACAQGADMPATRASKTLSSSQGLASNEKQSCGPGAGPVISPVKTLPPCARGLRGFKVTSCGLHRPGRYRGICPCPSCCLDCHFPSLSAWGMPQHHILQESSLVSRLGSHSPGRPL